jgi:fatty acid desaturase
VLCFTPFYRWRREHSIHHASAGDLDRRGTGDVWTMTVQEYLVASPPGRKPFHPLCRCSTGSVPGPRTPPHRKRS